MSPGTRKSVNLFKSYHGTTIGKMKRRKSHLKKKKSFYCRKKEFFFILTGNEWTYIIYSMPGP